MLTIVAVSRIVQSGSFATSSGSTASCDEPAYTRIDIALACPSVITDLLIAMPVTSPQERIAIKVGE